MSSDNKADRHDITEILLKVVLKHHSSHHQYIAYTSLKVESIYHVVVRIIGGKLIVDHNMTEVEIGKIVFC